MLKSIKGFLEKVDKKLEDLEITVDSKLSNFTQRTKPLQEKVLNNTLSSSKKLIDSLKDEASKRKKSNQTTITELAPHFYQDDVDLNAGLDFFESYETNLRAIQQNHQYLFSLAEKTDKKIYPIFQITVNKAKAMESFVNELAIIPKINTNIERLKQEIDTMCNQIESLENILIQQIDVIANAEMDAWKEKEKAITVQYQQKKIKELEIKELDERNANAKKEKQQLELERLKIQKEIEEQKLKIKLELEEQKIRAKERERADKLREQELALKLVQEQARLQEQFSRDLENYRKHGTLPKKKKKRKTKKLEDIQLENSNQESLDQFLGPPSESSSKNLFSESFEEEETKIEVIQTEETVEQFQLPSTNTPSGEINPPQDSQDLPSNQENVQDVGEDWM